MSDTYYLSDVAHANIKRGAAIAGLSMSAYIEAEWPKWVMLKVVIRDSGLVELIEARKVRANLANVSVVERNDVRVPTWQAPLEYDGVIWQAMFGAWGRRARELTISGDGVDALAAWVVKEEVVRRRAASRFALASEALELVGRGWTNDARNERARTKSARGR